MNPRKGIMCEFRRLPIVLLVSVVCVILVPSACMAQAMKVYKCQGQHVPGSIPSGINNVVLDGINLTTFLPGQFAHPSWNNTLYLRINARYGTRLKGNTFVGLGRLTHLDIKSTAIEYVDTRSFHGLPSLEKLDLSENSRIAFSNVLAVLNENASTTLPSLNWLNLANMGTARPAPKTFKLRVFNVLSRRKIKYLDLSYFRIDLIDLGEMVSSGMCEHLQHLVLKYTIISDITAGNRSKRCESLKTLDMRNMLFSGLVNMARNSLIPSPFFNGIMRIYLSMIPNVEKLLIENIFWKETVVFEKIVMNLQLYVQRLRTIDISRNNISRFNLTVNLGPNTTQTLRDIDFSGNGLDYFLPRAIGQSIHVERLNLSLNNLNKMNHDHSQDFELLLTNLTCLTTLSLSHNGLSAIPMNMFANNSKLRKLYLSDNTLTRVDFQISHLTMLELLDLSSNRFLNLDIETLNQFRMAFTLHNVQNNSMLNESDYHLQVILHDNPFICGCDEEYMTSLEWIQQSGIVHKNETRLKCYLNEKSIAIDNSAMLITKSYCRDILILKYGLIGLGIIITVIIIIVIIAILRHKRRVKKNALLEFLEQIRAGDKFKNLIFLSFCNEDGDYVLGHIYPRMKQEASLAINCERDLVGCGEMNFRPGLSVCLEVERCIEESAVVIFVLSNRFCQKSWCRMEVDTAKSMRKPIILLLLEELELEAMTPFIRKLFNRSTRAKWIRTEDGGYPRPPWPVLISSAIELASVFKADNEAEQAGDDIEMNQIAEV